MKRFRLTGPYQPPVPLVFELRARLGRSVEPHEAEAVRVWFPDGVPADGVDGLVARIQQLPEPGAAPTTTTAPRLVAVG